MSLILQEGGDAGSNEDANKRPALEDVHSSSNAEVPINSQSPLERKTQDVQAGIPHSGGTRATDRNGPQMMVRRMRMYDDITTSSSSSSSSSYDAQEPKKRVSADKGRSIYVDPVNMSQESDDYGEVRKQMMMHTKHFDNSADRIEEDISLSPHQVDLAVNKPSYDVLRPMPKIQSTRGTSKDTGRCDDLSERGDDAQYDNGRALSRRKELSERLEDLWEAGRETDIRIILMLLSTLVAFVLTVVGAPLSQVDVVDGACYTYWGYKDNCDSHTYTARTTFITCEPVKKRLQIGSAFSMMTVILLFAALVSCCILVKKNLLALRLFTLAVMATAFLFQMISWALIASIFSSRYCENTSLPRSTAYGVAFGMSLTSWFLILMGILATVALHVL